MTSPAPRYSTFLEVDYPDHDLNRLSTFFRPFAVLPILIVLALLSGPAINGNADDQAFTTGGILWLPTMFMLVFRQKYPRWWFDWNLEFVRFSTRVAAYLALLRDEYPSTDEEQAAIPHYFVLALLAIAAVFCVIIAWFVILFTGRYPRPLFEFVVGVFRWWLRVAAYAFLLTTDRYPPFRLKEIAPA